MLTQVEQGRKFRALPERDRAFIIPNPWDIGTARLLAHFGFEALATTSMGYAFSVGKRDNSVNQQQIIRHIAEIASATDLPVSADLENGFGDAPEKTAETIRLAAEAGAVGGSIEDATARQTGSQRHNLPLAGLSGSGCRRAVRTRPHEQGRYRKRRQVG